MLYKCMFNRWKYLFVILCVVMVQWVSPNDSLASDDTVLSVKNGQSLTEISQEIVNLINQNQYEEAREALNQLSGRYLANDLSAEKTVEAHKAYAEQIILVKLELNKHQIDQMALLDRSVQLYIASEVYEGNHIDEFSKRLQAFHQNAVHLQNIATQGNSKELEASIATINSDFSTLSCAIQIAYPPEYHNQLQSLIRYLNSSNKETVNMKEVTNHLVTVLQTMHQHTQDVNARLLTPQMSAQNYLFGISAILALAFLVVFRRKWQRLLDTQ